MAYREKRGAIQSYRYKLYSKNFLEVKNPSSGSMEIRAATLKHIEVFWRQPGDKREVELAQRHVFDMGLLVNYSYDYDFLTYPPFDLSFVDDFGNDDVIIQNVSVAGPLSMRAEEFYNFRLDGSRVSNGRTVYKIDLEPKDVHRPSMQGSLWLDGESYQLVEADVTLNEAVKWLPQPNKIHLSETFTLENGNLIPDEITWEVSGELPVAGPYRYYSSARLYERTTNPSLSGNIFEQESYTKAPDAAFKDSVFWNHQQIIPMDDREQSAFDQLASLHRNHKAIEPNIRKFEQIQKKENVHWGFNPLPDIRYNRVEGFFLGAEIQWNEIAIKRYVRDLTVIGKYGYGFADKRVKYSAEISKSFFDKMWTFGGRYYNDIEHKELTQLVGPVSTNSLTSLGYRFDRFNYFYVKGYDAFIKFQPFYFLQLDAKYTDRLDDSTRQNTNYGIIKWYGKFDPVHGIDEGRLRQIDVDATLRIGEGEGIFPRTRYWVIQGGVEHSNTDWLKSDFTFTKFYSIIRFHYPTTRRGSFDGKFNFAYAKDALPQQYLLDLYGGGTPYVLKTVAVGEFQGNRITAITVEHNFGGELLERTGLPLLKKGIIDIAPMFSVGYVHTSAKTKAKLVYPINDLNKPIYEAGFAIGDIFRLVRVECLWRLNQRNLGKTNFGLLATILVQKN